MTALMHGYLNPTSGEQDGTLLSEGTDNTTPLAGTAQGGYVTAPMRFGVRLVSDAAQNVLQLNNVIDTDVDYTFSAGCHGLFNNVLLAEDTTEYRIYSATITKNTGIPLIVVGYKLTCSTDWFPPGTSVVSNGVVIDTRGPLFNANYQEITCMLSTSCTTSSLTFNFSGSGGGTPAMVKIQIIVMAESLPVLDTVTVSAVGSSADKWAFAKAGRTNIADTCTSNLDSTVLANITNGIVTDNASYCALVNNGAEFYMALPKVSRVVGVVVRSGISYNLGQGLQILCDNEVVATLGAPLWTSAASSTWEPVFTPIACTTIYVRAGSNANSNVIAELEIYVESEPAYSDYTGYGSPLIIKNENDITANAVYSVGGSSYGDVCSRSAIYTFNSDTMVSSVDIVFASNEQVVSTYTIMQQVDNGTPTLGATYANIQPGMSFEFNRVFDTPLAGRVFTYLCSTSGAGSYYPTVVSGKLLAPLGTSVLGDTNLILYAKRKVLDTESSGIDTSVSIKVVGT